MTKQHFDLIPDNWWSEIEVTSDNGDPLQAQRCLEEIRTSKCIKAYRQQITQLIARATPILLMAEDFTVIGQKYPDAVQALIESWKDQINQEVKRIQAKYGG
jgi:hypothetical protein